MFTYKYSRPALTVDIIPFAEKDGEIYVLLIRRKNSPFQDMLAFAGGFVEEYEDIKEAAKRELSEETGLKVKKLTQFKTYGSPDRDPRGHTVSIVYYCFLDNFPDIKGMDDAKDANWFKVREILEEETLFAFDHNKILKDLITFLSCIANCDRLWNQICRCEKREIYKKLFSGF